MSKYKERVASAKTAGDFVAIWLIIFSLIVACGIISATLEWVQSPAHVWVFWVEFSFLILAVLLCLLCLIIHFKKADVRFWDPRVYWLKGYCSKINIEKTREMHTDFRGALIAKAMVGLLLLYIIFILMLVFELLLP